MVDTARQLLDEAKEGTTALMFISTNAKGDTRIGFCGDFAEDLEYATEAASEGFSRLVGHKIEARTKPINALPFMFRKA